MLTPVTPTPVWMEQAVSMCKEITTVTARITGREGIVKTQGQHAVQGHVKVRKKKYIYKEENLLIFKINLRMENMHIVQVIKM